MAPRLAHIIRERTRSPRGGSEIYGRGHVRVSVLIVHGGETLPFFQVSGQLAIAVILRSVVYMYGLICFTCTCNSSEVDSS